MALLLAALFAAGCVAGSGAVATPTSPTSISPSTAPFPTAAPTEAPTPPPSATSALIATPPQPPATPVPPPPSTPTPSPAPTVSYPLTLTDDEGNVVKIPTAPAKIVSLTPATTEIVYALGAGGRMVGDTDADDYPPAATKLTHVATYSSVDVEKIVSLNTDLVIAGGNNFNKPESLAQLRRLGIPVLVIYAADVEGVLHDIDLVGQAIGKPAGSAALVAWMRAQLQVVQGATAALPHPRTFYELDATKEIYGPADGSFITEMITLAGGQPITTGSKTVFSIPLERLVKANPEVIVLGDATYGTTPAIVSARPGWATMTAVKTSQIRGVDDTVVSRPGPRLVEGLRDLALAIHPDLVLPPLPSPPPSGT